MGRPSAARPYVVHRAGPDLDWDSRARSPRFVDMVTGTPGLYDTRAAALWDDEALHVASGWRSRSSRRGDRTRRVVFLENDVEVFIDGGDCYYELEVNALGTVYEVLFVWRDAYGPGSRSTSRRPRPVARHAVSFAGDHERTGPTFWRAATPGVRGGPSAIGTCPACGRP